jgi:hypothetical protein
MLARTHGRPRVANHHPFSEAQFKTLTYRPEFPDPFGGTEDARAFCRRFFHWYNTAHRHAPRTAKVGGRRTLTTWARSESSVGPCSPPRTRAPRTVRAQAYSDGPDERPC